MTNTADMRERWEARKQQIDLALTDLEDLTLEQLQARRTDLTVQVDEAREWTSKCVSALIAETRRVGNTRALGVDVAVGHPDPRAAAKLQPLRRALAQAEEAERNAKIARSEVAQRIKVVKQREVLKAIEERSEQKQREKQARQERLDREAVESVQPPSRRQNIVQWGKQLVKVQE